MPRPCEAEGHYRAKIVDYGLAEVDSGAVAINLKVHLLARWEQDGDEPAWVDISRSEMEAQGAVWVVTSRDKGNKVNEPAVQSLCNHAGWDGSLVSIAEQAWMPLPCQVTVKRDEYKDQVRFKVGFINSWEYKPGGMGNISEQRAMELQEKYGLELSRYRAPGTHPAEWESQTIGRDDVGVVSYPAGAALPGDEDIPF